MKEIMYLNIRDGLSSKPKLVPVSEFNPDKLIKNPNSDWYVSLFLYNEAHKAILEEKHTLAGILDTVTNRLYFDFDSKVNLEQAREDALTAATRLIEQGISEDAINCFFTGSKGFSIEVETDTMLTPRQFKAAVFHVAGDLQSFDGVVNDPNRIVRIANTKHQSSGLYKIPLTPEELSEMSIDDIKRKASKRRIIETAQEVAVLPEAFKHFELPVVEKSIAVIAQELTFDISQIDFKKRPKGMDEVRWLLQNGYFRSGERNNSMLCLAATYKNQEQPEEHTRALLRATAIMQSQRTGEDEFPDTEIELIVNQVYGPNWKGGMFTTRDPNNWLAQYARKMGIKAVTEHEDTPKTLHSIAPAFVNFVMNIEQNTIKTGIPSLDRVIPITLGSNVGVVAAPGAGKTALALKILKYNSKNGIITVFASLDMHRLRLFEKVAYNVTGLSREDLYNAIREGKYQQIVDKIQAEYGNVWFFDKASASVRDISNFVVEVEAQTGGKVKLVMIDYFERVNSDVSDDTAASKKVANEIQDMIVERDVAVITLCQPNKMSLGAGPDTEIQSYTSIKGSSFLYQSFRGIIGISRPFYTPKTKELDRYAIFNILKNDLGELDRLEYGWVGKTGEISELEDCERRELHDLMKIKNGEKDDKSFGGWD